MGGNYTVRFPAVYRVEIKADTQSPALTVLR